LSNELAIVGQESAALSVPTGAQFFGKSKLFDLKPATLSIVQPSSQGDGKKGNLIIPETGDEFETMRVTLLAEPQERRSYYVGNVGELNRIPENLHCFSLDMIEPDKRAKYPQAMTCKTCPKQDWSAFRAKKDKNIPTTKDDIPPCDAFYYATLIDTVYQMPLQLYIRSKSKQPFEKGMKNLARKLAMIAAAKKINPNIYDVNFRISTKKVQDGKYAYYILEFDDFQASTADEQAAFGVVFEKFQEQQTARALQFEQQALEGETKQAVASTQTDIDSAVTATTSTILDAEYVEEANGDITF